MGMFFNDTVLGALFGGKYICRECNSAMDYIEDEEILRCPNCGHEVDYERYGFEDDEEYGKLYPTKEEVLGIYDEEDDDDSGEYYDSDMDE